MRNEETAPARLASLAGPFDTLREDSSIPEKINLSVDEEKRQLQENARQKEAVLRAIEDESIQTLNSAFITLRRFHEVIEADDFIEDSRRRIEHARPGDRSLVLLDVLQSTSSLAEIIRRAGR